MYRSVLFHKLKGVILLFLNALFADDDTADGMQCSDNGMVLKLVGCIGSYASNKYQSSRNFLASNHFQVIAMGYI